MHGIIIVGNVGTGKSKLAQKYSDIGYLRFNGDDIRKMFNNGKYIYTKEENGIIIDIKIAFLNSCGVIDANFIIDGTNISKQERTIYRQILGEDDVKLSVVDYGMGNNKSLNRRLENPRDLEPNIWIDVHNKFMNEYEKPEKCEGFDDIITMYCED